MFDSSSRRKQGGSWCCYFWKHPSLVGRQCKTLAQLHSFPFSSKAHMAVRWSTSFNSGVKRRVEVKGRAVSVTVTDQSSWFTTDPLDMKKKGETCRHSCQELFKGLTLWDPAGLGPSRCRSPCRTPRQWSSPLPAVLSAFVQTKRCRVEESDPAGLPNPS